MAELKDRAFVVSVIDSRKQPIDGALTQIFASGAPGVQHYTKKGKPFVTQLSEGLAEVEVIVIYGQYKSSEKVRADIGTYTVTIPDQYLPAPPAAPPAAIPQPPVPDPVPPAPPPASKTWVTVLAILVPALVALIGAYWQFVYKPNHEVKDEAIGVFVLDATTDKAVPNATVTLVHGTQQNQKPADTLGTARFMVLPDEAKGLRVSVSATGYKQESREVDASGGDKQVYVLLSVQNPAPRTKKTPPPSGTWEVTVSGNISNQAVQKGSFTLAPQHDGSILVSGSFATTDMSVTATGKASMAANVLFLQFQASNTEGGSWTGDGELALSADGRELVGRIRSKRGDDLPLTLHKIVG